VYLLATDVGEELGAMLSQGGNDERVSMMVPSERAMLKIACGVGGCEGCLL